MNIKFDYFEDQEKKEKSKKQKRKIFEKSLNSKDFLSVEDVISDIPEITSALRITSLI